MAAKALVAWAWPPLVLAAVLATLVLAAGLLSPATQRVVTEALIKLSVVVGLYIFSGNSGVLSFGHIAFMGIGAYVASWLVIPPETKEVLLPGLPAFLAAAQWPPTLYQHHGRRELDHDHSRERFFFTEGCCNVRRN
jgi:branched-chain amino acid transport system permease protein